MHTPFEGFRPEAFEWFAALERDNSKTYFNATRERYQTEVRGALEAMLEELAGTFGGRVRLFRQHRDLRFSRDKSPYKTRTYGLLQNRPKGAASLYAELSARGLYAGTGYPGMVRDQLERYRAAVADEGSGAALAAATGRAEDAGLELAGASLRTAPRGYPRDHPRVELLRHKALIAGARLEDEGGIGRDAALAHAAGTWRSAAPLTAWLDEQVGPSEIPSRAR